MKNPSPHFECSLTGEIQQGIKRRILRLPALTINEFSSLQFHLPRLPPFPVDENQARKEKEENG